MNGDDVKILKKEEVYCGHFKIYKYRLKHRLFSGAWSNEVEREIYARNDASCALLYDPKLDAVLLIEQFRVGALNREFSPWLLEIVAGVFDQNEEPHEVAMREAKEEANMTVDKLHYVCDFLSSPGGISERVYLYCALVDASHAEGVFGLQQENEDIRVHVVPRRVAYSWIKKGKIKNSITIIGLQWLQLNRKSLLNMSK